jgi:glycosyltransferase involved in cell wall biosynthesis
MAERIGFISTRFAGTDGVTLESAKWAEIFYKDQKHLNFWYAGRLDRDPGESFCVPEAYFGHPEVEWINRKIWGATMRDPLVTRRIWELALYLKNTLYKFVEHFDISFLVLENVLAIPMHVPLGLAVTEFLAETRMQAIGHHHDFYWERNRFLVNSINDYLEMAFPPRDIDLQHTVINQSAQEELSWRKGVPSILVPNVFDFENPPTGIDEYNADIRAEIGLTNDDVMILQPTRVVPRKGIEHAIQMVKMLNDPKYKLVISHEAGDEGFEYRNMLSETAHREGIDIRFIETRIGDKRQLNRKGEKIYTLWDVYPHADLVTYTSLYEGFGNALLEAFYFKKPVFVNRYSIFIRDIEPKGFRVPIMEGYVTQSSINEVRRVLEDDAYREEMVEHNYQLASQFFSYSVLRRKLHSLVANIIGTNPKTERE